MRHSPNKQQIFICIPFHFEVNFNHLNKICSDISVWWHFQCNAEFQCMLNIPYISHHMVIKPFLLLGLADEYSSRRWLWSTVVNDHQKFMTLNGKLSWQPFQRYCWCPPKFKWFTWHNMPLWGKVCHLWVSLAHATVNLPTKFEVTPLTMNTKGNTKCQKWGS